MLYDKIVRRLLKESKLDSFARQINRMTMDGIKNVISSKSTKRKNKFRFKNEATDQEGSTIEVVTDVLFRENNNRVSVSAGWDWKNRAMDVLVKIPDDVDNYKNLQEIQSKLYEAIRHELEHSTQSDEEVDSAEEAYHEFEQDKYDVDAIKNYYANESEVPAFVAGIYHAAKRLRKPFYELMEDRLEKIKKNMSKRADDIEPSYINSSVEEIRTAWKNYASLRFPKAILNNTSND